MSVRRRAQRDAASRRLRGESRGQGSLDPGAPWCRRRPGRGRSVAEAPRRGLPGEPRSRQQRCETDAQRGLVERECAGERGVGEGQSPSLLSVRQSALALLLSVRQSALASLLSAPQSALASPPSARNRLSHRRPRPRNRLYRHRRPRSGNWLSRRSPCHNCARRSRLCHRARPSNRHRPRCSRRHRSSAPGGPRRFSTTRRLRSVRWSVPLATRASAPPPRPTRADASPSRRVAAKTPHSVAGGSRPVVA